MNFLLQDCDKKLLHVVVTVFYLWIPRHKIKNDKAF